MRTASHYCFDEHFRMFSSLIARILRTHIYSVVGPIEADPLSDISLNAHVAGVCFGLAPWLVAPSGLLDARFWTGRAESFAT